MKWNNHSNLEGLHAFLSASQYHWLNYSTDKLEEVYATHRAKEIGTELHEFASRCIILKQELKQSKKTLNQFVNDAIKFKMDSEKVLYYSDYCFGTADAISFRKNMLRIHDLKTGITKASMNQLKIYASLFCLEYGYQPDKIKMELRIYQNDSVMVCEPDPEEIHSIMQLIILFTKHLEEMKKEES